MTTAMCYNHLIARQNTYNKHHGGLIIGHNDGGYIGRLTLF